MELLGDLFELAIKLLIAYLLALWLQSQTGAESLVGPLIISALVVFWGRELIRRRGRSRH